MKTEKGDEASYAENKILGPETFYKNFNKRESSKMLKLHEETSHTCANAADFLRGKPTYQVKLSKSLIVMQFRFERKIPAKFSQYPLYIIASPFVQD